MSTVQTQESGNEALLALRLRHFRVTSDLFEKTLLVRLSEKSEEERPAEQWLDGVAEAIDFGFNVPNLFRRSLFIGAYALFEHHLNVFATDLRSQKSLSLRLEDLHGHGIERAKLYLKKVVAMPFPDQSDEWGSLKRYGELRNVLVHRYGQVDPIGRDKEFVEWIKGHPELGFIPLANVIWLDQGFVSTVLLTIEKFFTRLGYDPAAWERSEAQE